MARVAIITYDKIFQCISLEIFLPTCKFLAEYSAMDGYIDSHMFLKFSFKKLCLRLIPPPKELVS